MKFPIFKTKIEGFKKKFNLIDLIEKNDYFKTKAGKEIEKLFKRKNIRRLFVEKNSGKGTYSKMLGEILAEDKIDHFSIGDMVRSIDEELRDKEKKENLIKDLKKYYRGAYSFEQILNASENRGTKKLAQKN